MDGKIAGVVLLAAKFQYYMKMKRVQNHVGQDCWSSLVGSCVPVLYEDEVSTEPWMARLLE